MNNEVERIVQQTEALLRLRHEETLQETTPQRLHECLGEVVMMQINDRASDRADGACGKAIRSAAG